MHALHSIESPPNSSCVLVLQQIDFFSLITHQPESTVIALPNISHCFPPLVTNRSKSFHYQFCGLFGSVTHLRICHCILPPIQVSGPRISPWTWLCLLRWLRASMLSRTSTKLRQSTANSHGSTHRCGSVQSVTFNSELLLVILAAVRS